MKKLIALSALVVLSSFAASQTPVLPFVAAANEKFDTMIPGSYTSFAGFGGIAGFSRIGTLGLLMVNNNPVLLPPISAPNDMFGRGVDVRIRYNGVRKRWGGGFRVPNAGITVTHMIVVFYKAGLPVGVPVVAPINNLAWQWRGWDCGSIGGYDEVRVYGNGSLPGYVGMDNLRIQ